MKRLAASLVLAATANGYSQDLGQESALLMAQAYREHMAKLSSMSALEIWYSHIPFDELLERSNEETRRRQVQNVKEAQEKSSADTLTEKLTVVSNGRLRFRDIPPLLCHVEDIQADKEAEHALEEYRKTLSEDKRESMQIRYAKNAIRSLSRGGDSFNISGQFSAIQKHYAWY